MNLHQGILKSNQLIISRTSAVNLLTIPIHWTREMKIVIQEATLNPEKCHPTVLLVAKLELAFLHSKEGLSDWADRAFLQTVINDVKENLWLTMILTSVQVSLDINYPHIKLLFLNQKFSTTKIIIQHRVKLLKCHLIPTNVCFPVSQSEFRKVIRNLGYNVFYKSIIIKNIYF